MSKSSKATKPSQPTGEPAVMEAEAVTADARWQDADELRWAARHWAARIGVKITRLQLRTMATKWGSSSIAGRLTLNTELLDLPKRLGEFVIVHELVHLLAPNHGRVFKSFLLAYVPDWRERERDLHHHNATKKVADRTVTGRR